MIAQKIITEKFLFDSYVNQWEGKGINEANRISVKDDGAFLDIYIGDTSVLGVIHIQNGERVDQIEAALRLFYPNVSIASWVQATSVLAQL